MKPEGESSDEAGGLSVRSVSGKFSFGQKARAKVYRARCRMEASRTREFWVALLVRVLPKCFQKASRRLLKVLPKDVIMCKESQEVTS